MLRFLSAEQLHDVAVDVDVDSVDEMKLNYDDKDPLWTTDFTGLCAAMASLQEPDKKVGKHSSVCTTMGFVPADCNIQLAYLVIIIIQRACLDRIGMLAVALP